MSEPGTLEDHLAWLYPDPGRPCLCEHAIGSGGRLHGITMGKEWHRTTTHPKCPHHGTKAFAAPPDPKEPSDMTTTAVVVYCPKCDYFLKTGVAGPIGTHGCIHCGELMEVYVPQELANPDFAHRRGIASKWNNPFAPGADREDEG